MGQSLSLSRIDDYYFPYSISSFSIDIKERRQMHEDVFRMMQQTRLLESSCYNRFTFL